MPGCAVSHAWMLSRRFLYSFSITTTASCDPDTAASAAFWVIDVMFDVVWPWIVLKAEVSSFGAIVQPQRHPVIAYDFDAEPAITVRSRWRSNSTFTRLCGTFS